MDKLRSRQAVRTENPFLKAGRSVQVDPLCTKPFGPAPHTIARERIMMSMKRTILIKEVKYSNQAKIVLGMVKMTQVVTTKMVTVHMVNDSAIFQVRPQNKEGYRNAARRSLMLVGICTLTRGSLGKIPSSPELDENIEKGGFRGNNRRPTCARVNYRPRMVDGGFLPSHSAKPAPKAKAGSTHRSA